MRANDRSMKPFLIACLPPFSPIACAVVGTGYGYLNERYVVKWWIHSKYCFIGESHSFDANDFTLIFFTLLLVLTAGPLFIVFKGRWWPLKLGVLTINALICIYFISMNMWA